MLIILEGMDCTGKSTLAKKLSEKLDFPIVKGSSFEQAKCSNADLFKSFMELTKLKNTILDRFIYSNEVYASIYEDYSILSDEQRRFVEREIAGSALLVYLHANNTTLIARIEKRGDDYVTIDKFNEIRSSYLSALAKSKYIEGMSFNTAEMSTDDIVNEIVSRLNN